MRISGFLQTPSPATRYLLSEEKQRQVIGRLFGEKKNLVCLFY